MRKFLLGVVMVSIIFIMTACNNVNFSSINKAKLSQDGEVIFTFTKEDHADEIKVLAKAVSKVKKQNAKVDMPPSDYQLDFALKNDETLRYSLWIDPESSFILKNASSSHFIQLSHSDTEKLNQVVTKFDASGIKHFNFYFLVMAIPVLIVVPIMIDVLGRKLGKKGV